MQRAPRNGVQAMDLAGVEAAGLARHNGAALAQEAGCDSHMPQQTSQRRVPWREELARYDGIFLRGLCLASALLAPGVSAAEEAEMRAAGDRLLGARRGMSGARLLGRGPGGGWGRCRPRR